MIKIYAEQGTDQVVLLAAPDDTHAVIHYLSDDFVGVAEIGRLHEENGDADALQTAVEEITASPKRHIYYYMLRPPGIGSQPACFSGNAPSYRYSRMNVPGTEFRCHGWVAYQDALPLERSTHYDLFPADPVERFLYRQYQETRDDEDTCYKALQFHLDTGVPSSNIFMEPAVEWLKENGLTVEEWKLLKFKKNIEQLV